MRRKGKRWTEDEKEYLRRNYPNPDISLDEMAEHLGRTKWSIKHIASKLGRYRERVQLNGINDLKWRIWCLRKDNPNMNNREVAEELGIKKGAVVGIITRHGLGFHPPAGEMPDWLKEKIKEKEGGL